MVTISRFLKNSNSGYSMLAALVGPCFRSRPSSMAGVGVVPSEKRYSGLASVTLVLEGGERSFTSPGVVWHYQIAQRCSKTEMVSTRPRSTNRMTQNFLKNNQKDDDEHVDEVQFLISITYGRLGGSSVIY
jgi:hypothetical protein